jgi:hypothetical protein
LHDGGGSVETNSNIIIALALPGFVLFWMAITALIAVAGGWHGLAKSHPLPDHLYEKGRRHSFQSLRLGQFANYNSSVHVTVYSSGIMLTTLFIFSILHKPIFIRYEAMISPEFGRFIIHYVSFTVDGCKIRIMGKSALVIKERLTSNPV